MSTIKKIIVELFYIKQFLYVKTFARLFYDKKYLNTKWFDDSIRSPGWGWAARDIHARIHFLKNAGIRWPVSPENRIGANIEFDPDDLNNMNGFGCYFQTLDGKITIGKGTYIASNVGIITANHDVNDVSKHASGKDVVIGKQCWLGMNSVLLPGVELGDNTVVGAGSVVTKSFKQGHCVIAGCPAKIIRELKKNEW